MVGAKSRIDRDVPPYMMVEGHPARIRGLNLVGLKRAKSADIDLDMLRKAYRLLYRSDLPVEKALQTLKDWPPCRSLTHLLQFLEASLAHPQRRGPLPALRGNTQAPDSDS
jgi:UDP-N-acetylglucosamine acyltransferase